MYILKYKEILDSCIYLVYQTEFYSICYRFLFKNIFTMELYDRLIGKIVMRKEQTVYLNCYEVFVKTKNTLG